MLVVVSAALPWIAIQLISLAGQYAPVFMSHLDESSSGTAIALSVQAQRLFEHLVFAIPTGAFLARVIRGAPITTALLVIAGYSVAWLAWGFLEGAPLSESVESLLVYYHLPIPLLLGLSIFGFGTLYKRRKREIA